MTPPDRNAVPLPLLLLALPALLYALLAGPERLVRFFPDDAFYYLTTAFQFTATGVITFDGIHPTNGYHPLHFWLVAPLTLFCSRPGLLAVLFAAAGLAPLVAALVLGRVYRDRLPPWLGQALVALLAAAPLASPIVLNAGIEAATVLLATIAVVAALLAARARGYASLRHDLALSVALTLALLARLDDIVGLAPFVALIVFDLSHGWSAERRKALASVFLLPLVVGLLYLGMNQVLTGHFLTVSAVVKSKEPTPLSFSWLAATGGGLRGMVVGLAPIGTAFAALVVAWRWRDEASAPVVAASAVACIVFYLYLMLVAPFFFRWYLAFPYACLFVQTAFLTAFLAPRLEPIRLRTGLSPRAAALLAATLSVGSSTAFLVWIGGRAESMSGEFYRQAARINQVTDARSVIGAFDAGILSYQARARVIDLDGLANSFEYYEDFLSRRRLLEYLRREQVTHLLVTEGRVRDQAAFVTGSYTTTTLVADDRVVLRREDEVLRDPGPRSTTVLFRVEERPD